MKKSLFIAALIVQIAQAALSETDRLIRLHVEWINDKEMGYEGCDKNSIMLRADHTVTVVKQGAKTMIGIKLTPHWEGKAIKVQIIEVKKVDSAEAVDGDSVTVLLAENKIEEFA